MYATRLEIKVGETFVTDAIDIDRGKEIRVRTKSNFGTRTS
jgi:hypothetical protein